MAGSKQDRTKSLKNGPPLSGSILLDQMESAIVHGMIHPA